VFCRVVFVLLKVIPPPLQEGTPPGKVVNLWLPPEENLAVANRNVHLRRCTQVELLSCSGKKLKQTMPNIFSSTCPLETTGKSLLNIVHDQ